MEILKICLLNNAISNIENVNELQHFILTFVADTSYAENAMARYQGLGGSQGT